MTTAWMTLRDDRGADDTLRVMTTAWMTLREAVIELVRHRL